MLHLHLTKNWTKEGWKVAPSVTLAGGSLLPQEGDDLNVTVTIDDFTLPTYHQHLLDKVRKHPLHQHPYRAVLATYVHTIHYTRM